MPEDWVAVAEAINARVNKLGWSQRELVKRSQVSSAIVREIQRNTVNRKRSPRTLESLSKALQWDPKHLERILHGEDLPESANNSQNSCIARVEKRLDALNDRVAGMESRLDVFIDELRDRSYGKGR